MRSSRTTVFADRGFCHDPETENASTLQAGLFLPWRNRLAGQTDRPCRQRRKHYILLSPHPPAAGMPQKYLNHR